MPNNLTDAEIKKALECCIKWKREGDCAKCPLWESEKLCVKEIRILALDLINTLEEENKSLKAEVERLKNAYKQCAWERDIFAEDMTQEIKKDCSYLMLDIKTIKAEAYKEFAKRVKLRFSGTLSCSGEVITRAVDNLLNELVGDENGKDS